MFVVIFEVCPHPDQWDAYLAHAAALRPELVRIPGFLDNLRYRSRTRAGWLVSLSSWADERALVRWRAHAMHHAVQADGRARVFADYRLRVAEVVADTAPPPGLAPAPFRRDTTATGAAKAALLAELPAADPDPSLPGALAADRFDGVTDPAASLSLSFWPDLDAMPVPAPAAARVRVARILRDYGLRDRAEAPQYHAPAPD